MAARDGGRRRAVSPAGRRLPASRNSLKAFEPSDTGTCRTAAMRIARCVLVNAWPLHGLELVADRSPGRNWLRELLLDLDRETA